MIQVYTGNGKGKTTASIGLAVRAVGAGMKVFIGQFVKGMKYSELNSLAEIDNIEIEQYGLDTFIYNKPKRKDIEAARKALNDIKEILEQDEYQVVILDEANIATFFDLFSAEELIEVLESRTENTEVIITGRYADQKIIDYADLVTEMKCIKHYYDDGVEAREGIEK